MALHDNIDWIKYKKEENVNKFTGGKREIHFSLLSMLTAKFLCQSYHKSVKLSLIYSYFKVAEHL